nr:TRAP transporter fused permease subunit [Halomonas smyrnensis]
MQSRSSPLIRGVSLAVILSMAAFHVYVVMFGAPQPFVFRGLHLGFSLAIIFLLFPFVRGGGKAVGALDLACFAGMVISVGYLIINQDVLYARFQLVDPLTPSQFWCGVVLTCLVLEGCRRTLGPALPLTAILFIIYAVLSGTLTPEYLIDVLYLTTEGIFGIPLNVSATFLFLFVLFGALAEKLGTGKFFIDFSTAVAGRTAGGPAKVASISSALFGSISGSAVANIMTTGSYTIPLMKRLGYRAPFAGSVEAVASTGGQIMPPVMGASAFVMAEVMGVSYLNVMLIALIPAVLFFVSVFLAIHFEAKRQGLSGLDEASIPVLKTVIKQRGHQILPLFIVIGVLVSGYSPAYAAFAGIISIIPTSLLRRETRKEFRAIKVLEGVENGVVNAVKVALACACAGIVVGVVVHSGLGLEFTGVVRHIASDSMLLALILTAVAGIIIGMGLPTTPAYILQTALLIPALIKLGVTLEAAHLFALYFAIMSAITPPVAIGLFAANSISGARFWPASVAAFKLGMTGYIVPFMFVYSPALILQGTPLQIAMAAFSAILGVTFLASGLHGYLTRPLGPVERVLLVASAMVLIYQGVLTDLVGIAMAGLAYIIQRNRVQSVSTI